MKHTTLFTALAVLTLAACGKEPAKEPFVPTPLSTPATTLPPGHPAVNPAEQTETLSGAPQVEQTQSATVVSSIDVPGFTYLEVKQNEQTRWLAASTIAAKKGDVVQFDNGSTMVDFKSTTLNRNFPSITFVNKATIVKGK